MSIRCSKSGDVEEWEAGLLVNRHVIEDKVPRFMSATSIWLLGYASLHAIRCV